MVVVGPGSGWHLFVLVEDVCDHNPNPGTMARWRLLCTNIQMDK